MVPTELNLSVFIEMYYFCIAFSNQEKKKLTCWNSIFHVLTIQLSAV